MSGQKGKVHLGPNVSSSAHYRGCVVNGSGAIWQQYEYYYCCSQVLVLTKEELDSAYVHN